MFNFNKENHTYTLDDKPLTGVTTILSVVAKPALIQWSANEAINYVEEYLRAGNTILSLGEPTVEKMLKEARTAHRRKKEDAGQKGVDIHSLVENWIKDGSLPEEPNEQLINFISWAQENKVKFLASEQQVYSRKYWYAGTYDFICEIDGKKYVGDLKTSSGIYGREYFAQCAAYRLAYNEIENTKERSFIEKLLGKWPEGKDPFHGVVIVRCGKNGDFEVKYSFDYKTDKKIFLACLELYRGLQTFNATK